MLNEVVSHLNQMKTLADSSKKGSQAHGSALDALVGSTTPDSSPSLLKRKNIRDSVAKTIQRSTSRGSLSRGSMPRNTRRLSVPTTVTSLPTSDRSSSPGPGAASSVVSSSPSKAGAIVIDEDEDASAASNAAAAPPARGRSQTVVPEGAPPNWEHVRISSVLDPHVLKKITPDDMRRTYKAGTVILPQDVTREVAIQVLWTGTAKVCGGYWLFYFCYFYYYYYFKRLFACAPESRKCFSAL